jgi:hypothetical protein
MSGNYADAPPMPKVKPTKDPKIEDDAIKQIMTLALYGAVMDAQAKGRDVMEANYLTVQLFKDAGMIE